MSTSLLTPEHAKLISLATTGLSSSPHTRKSYATSLAQYLSFLTTTTTPTLISRSTVQSFIDHCLSRRLSNSTINLHLSAIRRLASELVAHGHAPESILPQIKSIRSLPVRGVRSGNWLTKDEAQELLNSTAPASLERVLVALLLGCGLRRHELRKLTLDHIQQREGRWCIVDIVGKGGRVRTIPMPNWCKVVIDEYEADEKQFKPTDQDGNRILCPFSETTIYNTIVRESRQTLGKAITPHDLRRTFSKLARKGGAPLEQIQLSLGHESIETTKRYLGTEIDYDKAPCDVLGIETPNE